MCRLSRRRRRSGARAPSEPWRRLRLNPCRAVRSCCRPTTKPCRRRGSAYTSKAPVATFLTPDRSGTREGVCRAVNSRLASSPWLSLPQAHSLPFFVGRRRCSRCLRRGSLRKAPLPRPGRFVRSTAPCRRSGPPGRRPTPTRDRRTGPCSRSTRPAASSRSSGLAFRRRGRAFRGAPPETGAGHRQHPGEQQATERDESHVATLPFLVAWDECGEKAPAGRGVRPAGAPADTLEMPAARAMRRPGQRVTTVT